MCPLLEIRILFQFENEQGFDIIELHLCLRRGLFDITTSSAQKPWTVGSALMIFNRSLTVHVDP